MKRLPDPLEAIRLDIFNGSAQRGDAELRLGEGEFGILAAMALHRHVKTSEEWCDRLWPDRELESSLRLLKVYVHRIRMKFATPRVIETVSGGYRIGASVTVDVTVLEGLLRGATGSAIAPECEAAAQRAYEGFAARCYLRLNALPFYDEIERRLMRIGIELGRLLAQNAAAAGEHAAALEVAEQLCRVEPYDDVAAELLIRTHLQLGRRDAAARAFHQFCRTLRDELAVPPPQHLVDLLARVS